MTDHCHANDITLTLHSCGNGRELIPGMIEAGIDAWQLQENTMNLDEVIAEYSDKISLETYFELPLDDKIAIELVEEKMKIVSTSNKTIISFFDMAESRSFDPRRFIYQAEIEYN